MTVTMDSIAFIERENSELRNNCQILTDQYQRLAQVYKDLEGKYRLLSEEYQQCQDDKALLKSQCDRVSMTKEHLKDDKKK